eukprot:6201564-Pleurochrysis_carterae.AAC.4
MAWACMLGRACARMHAHAHPGMHAYGVDRSVPIIHNFEEAHMHAHAVPGRKAPPHRRWIKLIP